MKSILAVVAACLILVIGWAAPARACTLWAAAGEAAGGGTLLAKNRDNAPDQADALFLVRPENGLAYVGLFAMVQGRRRLTAGVNEAGLTVVSATAGGIPKVLRKGPSQVKGLLGRVLAECRDLDEVMKKRDWFAGHSPVIYMASDRFGAAWIEVGPGNGGGDATPDGASADQGGNGAPGSSGGQAAAVVAVRKASGGVLNHTNHYLSEELSPKNSHIGQSSAARLARIQALLAERAGPFALEDFIRMSRDQAAGPDDSIFRAGKTSQSTRTLATFAVRTPAEGGSVLEVSGFETPGEPWRDHLVLDRAFWQRTPPGSRLLLAPVKPGSAGQP